MLFSSIFLERMVSSREMELVEDKQLDGGYILGFQIPRKVISWGHWCLDIRDQCSKFYGLPLAISLVKRKYWKEDNVLNLICYSDVSVQTIPLPYFISLFLWYSRGGSPLISHSFQESRCHSVLNFSYRVNRLLILILCIVFSTFPCLACT